MASDQDDQGELRYDAMVDQALRGVARTALELVLENGLPGQHHFYITFRTRFPGVELPQKLLDQHPEEMTIVLQHQFWGLEVDDIGFAVTLSFNRVNERVRVPFAALTGFADPSAKFGLQFDVDLNQEPPLPETLISAEYDPEPEDGEEKPEGSDEAGAEDGGNVITLDAFRKK